MKKGGKMGKVFFISSVLFACIVFLEHTRSVRKNKKDRGRSYPTNIITKRSMILGIIIRVVLVCYWLSFFFHKK